MREEWMDESYYQDDLHAMGHPGVGMPGEESDYYGEGQGERYESSAYIDDYSDDGYGDPYDDLESYDFSDEEFPEEDYDMH